MDISKKYIIENIRIKYWNIFLNTCTKKIMNILTKKNKVQGYKLEQKILYFNTFLLGICELSKYVLFPKKRYIKKHETFLKDDLLYNYSMTDMEFRQIIEIILETNNFCTTQIKEHTQSIIDENIIVNKQFDNDYIKLQIFHKQYPNIFKIKVKDYDRLKTLFVKNDGFDMFVCVLMTRYKYYGVVKEGISLSAGDVYDFIKKYNYGNETLEAFAGTLNSNLTNYCSLFYDIEKYFGSKGSFLNLNLDECKYNIIISNPPYITNVMDLSSTILVNFLNCNNSMIIVVIPDWRSKDEYDNDKQLQISINEHEQVRQLTRYNGYYNLRVSKYFKYVMCVGDYAYYNFFQGTQKVIRDNTLFVVLSNGHIGDEQFKKYMINKLQ